jgi:hypothetical protein
VEDEAGKCRWLDEVPPGSGMTVSGMNAVLAAWHHHREQQQRAAAMMLGYAVTRATVPPDPALPELLIPAAIVAVGDKVAEGQLVEAVLLPWFDIVKALERDPNLIYQLSTISTSRVWPICSSARSSGSARRAILDDQHASDRSGRRGGFHGAECPVHRLRDDDAAVNVARR